MRWIFISLVVLNLATFAWAMVAGSNSEQKTKNVSSRNPYAHYPELVLLSEIQSGEKQVLKAQIERVIESQSKEVADNVIDEEPVEVVSEAKALCEMVGPFENANLAGDFIKRLGAIEVIAELKELELPAGPGYWVYLSPEKSRRDALRLLSELHAKRIDSYVIPKGELANGISLGMFSKKTLSDARVREMKAIGLTPLVEEIERTYRELWVMLLPSEAAKMSKLTWEKSMNGINLAERRQNYCLDVASQENFH